MKPLLPQAKSKDAGKICVVIDLDETLVHSSFKVSVGVCGCVWVWVCVGVCVCLKRM